ncbi:MAG TPA: hypothetical protein VN706_00395 [Gemmatimonadaceae bacterium]|nr:hypothetical protein [Gemmatimonadaceae bacterium]
MPRTRRHILLSLLVLALLPACHPRHDPAIEEDDSDAVTLSVVSHHRLNVVIYNVAQGHRDRIGEVTAAGTTSFKLHLRRYAANELVLLADPIGSPTEVKTETLHLVAGDVLEWTLEDDLARSHYEIH